MPLPLAALGLVGLGLSATANMYAQRNSRKLYQSQYDAFMNLHRGYEKYLAKNGRSINPNRAWASYYGQAQKASNNAANSLLGSLGTFGGTVGAGAMLYQKNLYSAPKTKRRL